MNYSIYAYAKVDPDTDSVVEWLKKDDRIKVDGINSTVHLVGAEKRIANDIWEIREENGTPPAYYRDTGDPNIALNHDACVVIVTHVIETVPLEDAIRTLYAKVDPITDSVQDGGFTFTFGGIDYAVKSDLRSRSDLLGGDAAAQRGIWAITEVGATEEATAPWTVRNIATGEKVYIRLTNAQMLDLSAAGLAHHVAAHAVGNAHKEAIKLLESTEAVIDYEQNILRTGWPSNPQVAGAAV